MDPAKIGVVEARPIRALWMLIRLLGLVGSRLCRERPPAQPPPSSSSPISMWATRITGRAPEWDRHIAEFTRLAGEQCKTYIAGIPQTGAPTGEIICPPYPTHPDLVVWPESPAPFFGDDPRFQQAMRSVAAATHAPLIVGGIGFDFSSEEHTTNYYNSAFVIAA